MSNTTGRTEEKVFEEHAPTYTPASTMTKVPSPEHTASVSHNDQALHLEGEAEQQYPLPPLILVEPAPMKVSSVHAGAERPTTSPSSPPPPASASLIGNGLTSDPTELRQAIFPPELPPRPSLKRNWYARIFKRQGQGADDIELCSPDSLRVSNYVRQKERYVNLCALGIGVLFVGVAVGSIFYALLSSDEKAREV